MGKTSNLAVLSNTFDVNSSGAVSVGGSTGTAGQVLTSQGSGAAPQWVSPVAPLTLLATLTPGSGATTISATSLSQCETFLIVTDSVTLSTSGLLQFALSSNNGSSYGTSVPFVSVLGGTNYGGMVQIMRAKTAATNKPFFGSSNAQSLFNVYTSTTGVINAIRIDINSAATFTGTGNIYIYGIV